MTTNAAPILQVNGLNVTLGHGLRSTKILHDVVQLAPRFGLARLQLATAHSRLARASAAIEQTRLAGEMLQPALGVRRDVGSDRHRSQGSGDEVRRTGRHDQER